MCVVRFYLLVVSVCCWFARLLVDDCCSVFVVCCHFRCCSLFVVCCLTFGVRCLLFVV